MRAVLWKVIAFAAVPAAAQAADVSYTATQADRGKALYLESCVTCHGGDLSGGEDSPSLTGDSFQQKWGKLPLGALFNFINTQMPLGRPGVQGAGGSADLVAYILSVNNVPAGAAELPPDAQALNKMSLQKKN